MNDEQKSALLEYEELKIQEKEIKARIDELKPTVLEVVPEGAKINARNGHFELKKRDNWKYSEEINNQESALKEAKAEAVAKGEATNNPTFFVEYRQK